MANPASERILANFNLVDALLDFKESVARAQQSRETREIIRSAWPDRKVNDQLYSLLSFKRAGGRYRRAEVETLLLAFTRYIKDSCVPPRCGPSEHRIVYRRGDVTCWMNMDNLVSGGFESWACATICSGASLYIKKDTDCPNYGSRWRPGDNLEGPLNLGRQILTVNVSAIELVDLIRTQQQQQTTREVLYGGGDARWPAQIMENMQNWIGRENLPIVQAAIPAIPAMPAMPAMPALVEVKVPLMECAVCAEIAELVPLHRKADGTIEERHLVCRACCDMLSRQQPERRVCPHCRAALPRTL
jgi:hypothetical protein